MDILLWAFATMVFVLLLFDRDYFQKSFLPKGAKYGHNFERLNGPTSALNLPKLSFDF